MLNAIGAQLHSMSKRQGLSNMQCQMRHWLSNMQCQTRQGISNMQWQKNRGSVSDIRNILLSPMASNIKYTMNSIHVADEQNSKRTVVRLPLEYALSNETGAQ